MRVKIPPILEAKAKGIIKRDGFTPAVLAMARTIGRSMATVPVLLTKAATTAVTIITTKKRFFSGSGQPQKATGYIFCQTGLENGTSDDEKEDHDDDGRVGETAERGFGRHNPAEHERSHTAEGDNVGPDFAN